MSLNPSLSLRLVNGPGPGLWDTAGGGGGRHASPEDRPGRQITAKIHRHLPTKVTPEWLQRLRLAARQRPRTRFVKITWIALQPLLRERDILWNAATSETRAAVLAMRESENYAYQRPTVGPDRGLDKG
jgi:hypothetical protein